MTEELGDVTSSADVGAENNGPASNETGINEAWNPLLQQLPDAYHNVVTPHLKEWDRGVQQRFDSLNQRYSPYQKFVDQKVDPQLVEVGLSLVEQLRNDPNSFYQELGQRLGISPQEAKELVEEEPDSGQGEYVDPRYDELAQQQQQLQQWVQQQEAQRYQQEIDSKVRGEVDALIAKYNIPKGPVLANILQRAAATTEGDLEAAYQQEMQYQQYLAQNNPNANAPRVMSGSGSAGATPQKSINDMSGSERRAALAAQLRAGLGS